MQRPFITVVLFVACVMTLSGLASAAEPVPVNVDNFTRAETDNYFARFVKDAGIGKLHHDRALADIDKQTVIRMNRDTLYSFAVFDLDASPVTFTLPDAGKRFMSVLIIDEDQYAPEVFYTPGPHALTNHLYQVRLQRREANKSYLAESLAGERRIAN